MNTYVLDNFAGTAATLLQAHTPDTGSAWEKWTPVTVSDAHLDGSGGLVVNDDAQGWYLNTTALPGADYDVEITFTGKMVGQLYLFSRMDRTTGTCLLGDDNWEATNSSMGAPVQINKVGGTIVLSATVNNSEPSGLYHPELLDAASHVIRLAAYGTAVAIIVDGEVWQTKTEASTVSPGFAGLMLYKSVAQGGGKITKFQVTDRSLGIIVPGRTTLNVQQSPNTIGYVQPRPRFNTSNSTWGVSLKIGPNYGGNGSYTYQWYQSTTNGVKGSSIGGATSQQVNVTGLTPGTTYYFTCDVNDTVPTGVVSGRQVTFAAPATPQVLIAFDGNSICLGSGPLNFNNSYFQRCVTHMSSAGIKAVTSNFGVSGQTLANIATDIATQLGSLRSTFYAKRIAVIEGGTNDLAGNASDATTRTRLQSVCTNLRAAPWSTSGSDIIAVMTIESRDAGFSAGATAGSYETARLTYNTWLRSQFNVATSDAYVFAKASGGTVDADYLIDIAADANLGTNTATADNTTYFVDAIHPTDAGDALWATHVNAFLDIAATLLSARAYLIRQAVNRASTY